MTSDAFNGFVEMSDDAKNDKPHLVGKPATGDMASAYWTGEMWAFNQPGELVQQLDFEPTHFRPRILV